MNQPSDLHQMPGKQPCQLNARLRHPHESLADQNAHLDRANCFKTLSQRFQRRYKFVEPLIDIQRIRHR